MPGLILQVTPSRPSPSRPSPASRRGVEYKVRVRASYDGAAGDWSGEVTIAVAGTG